MELIAITENGELAKPARSLPVVTADVVGATTQLYASVGYEPPWIGYLAFEDETCVGACGFKSPPQDDRVEIAYFTFPEHESRGVATQMARELIRLAKEKLPTVVVAAQTLPEENASTSILKKLQFRLIGTLEHPEDGPVWEWQLANLTKFDIGDREIDGDDYFVVIEPVYLSVSTYEGPVKYEEDLASFSNEQRLVLACHWYLSEVNNGGHHQFYDNSTGIVWKDTLKGLAAIAASEAVLILEESTRRFGGDPSLDREERQDQLERMKPQFDDLDNALYQFELEFDFDGALLKFIRAHRQKFFFSGYVEQP